MSLITYLSGNTVQQLYPDNRLALRLSELESKAVNDVATLEALTADNLFSLHENHCVFLQARTQI